jgi:hypothetical protein
MFMHRIELGTSRKRNYFQGSSHWHTVETKCEFLRSGLKSRQWWDQDKLSGSHFAVSLSERNARALCKPRRLCICLKPEINILIGLSRPNQTEQHWLSSRFQTKCLNTALDSGLIYSPLHRDGADGGGDKWRSKGSWRRSLSDVLVRVISFQ